MATDWLALSGIAGLVLIASGLGWESRYDAIAASPPELARGLVALADTPCPHVAMPKTLHSTFLPQKLVPSQSRSGSA
jgi:fermentation-respiration switch protein FrsA (DUF1100 family)